VHAAPDGKVFDPVFRHARHLPERRVTRSFG
jgi:hypothetical protein